MNPFGFLKIKSEANILKFFIAHLIFLFSSLSLQASEQEWVSYSWNLEIALSRLPSCLMVASQPLKKEDIIPIFKELDKMKPHEVRKSDVSDASTDSTMSGTSNASHEYVEAMQEALDFCFDKKSSTTTQLENRDAFIQLLNSLEPEVDPIVFQKGIELIADRLSN